MPNDARLGLVVGVGLVIAVAVLTFRKDANPRAAAGNVETPRPSTTSSAVARASAMSGLPTAPAGRSHTVQEGETLCSLAVRYYGDAARSSFLFRANQDRIRAPDHVPIGTVLYIPDLPGELVAGRPRR
jgi:nucleoid-associated protein YgaU